MTQQELHDLVETTLDGWPYGTLVGPGTQKPARPETSVDATSLATWSRWMFDAETTERLTANTNLIEGAVLVRLFVQEGDDEDTVNGARGELAKRFRGISTSEHPFEPVELGEEFDEDEEDGVGAREIRIPYRRQEHWNSSTEEYE